MTRTVLLLFLLPLAVRAIFVPFLGIEYDEAAYAWTAAQLAHGAGWADLAPNDLFFYPPLLNYLSAGLVAAGVDRLIAVRLVTLLLASAIPPLLYLLVRRAGHGERPAVLAALLWVVQPTAFVFSVRGFVETPMLAFVLAAVLLLQLARDDGRASSAALAGLALAVAVWTKETALGVAPLFPLFLGRRWRAQAAWAAGFLLPVIPLALAGIGPGPQGLFFEVTNSLVRWDLVSLDTALQNLVRLHGLEPCGPGRISFTLGLVILGVLAAAVLAARKEILARRFLPAFSFAAVVVYLVFFTLFWKKFHYYLLPVYLFLVVFLAVLLARRMIWAWIYLGLLALLAAFGLEYALREPAHGDLAAALRAAELQLPGGTVLMPHARVADYLVERDGLNLRVLPSERTTCRLRDASCLRTADFLLGSSTDLLALASYVYCGTWPPPVAPCVDQARRELLGRVRLLGDWGDLKLFRVLPAAAADVRPRPAAVGD
jgi:4-amino-4-deoxy-L-arabinose transferase-like glycosyltransferase